MTYNTEGAIERKNAEAGTTVDAVIVSIRDGKIRDFIKTEKALKEFKNPDGDAIYVVSEGRFDGRIHKCETLFSYENNEKGVTVYDPRSNLASFKKIYGNLPKVEQKVKHVSNSEGYFKLMVKI